MVKFVIACVISLIRVFTNIVQSQSCLLEGLSFVGLLLFTVYFLFERCIFSSFVFVCSSCVMCFRSFVYVRPFDGREVFFRSYLSPQIEL